MRTYKFILRRSNGTKIHITANAVSVNKNRIGFHFENQPSLWAKLDDVQLEMMRYDEKI